MYRKRKALVGIDLFAGAGGLSLGASWAGIDVRGAVEDDRWAATTYRLNHPRTNVIVDDICAVPANAIRSLMPERAVTVLFGGPPCRGFSYSNQRTRHLHNASNWLFSEFLRVVRAIRPDWVVFENVRGFQDTSDGFFLRAVLEALDELGYDAVSTVLNAVDFGVPQERQRFFIIASRAVAAVAVLDEICKRRKREVIAVRDALADLPDLANGASTNWLPYRNQACSHYATALRGRRQLSANHLVTCSAEYVVRRFPFVPPGGNWEAIPRRLLRNYRAFDCHTGLYHRLDERRPSVVLGNYRKNMLIHPWADRGLSVREAARLQSFPDGYTFYGSIGFQQQQVGNAVPPRLARAVFGGIVQLAV